MANHNDINDEIILDESFGGYVNTERKAMDSLPSEYINKMFNVSTNQGTIWRYGSESFKVIKYPSDVDFKEDIKFTTRSRDVAIDQFLDQFIKLIKTIKSKKGIYLGDVKLGLDHMFDSIDIGALHNGTITGFDMDKVKLQLKQLYAKKMIVNSEYDHILKLVKPYMTLADYDELMEELRNLHVIRWTEDEILRGYKLLPGDRKYTLREALHDKTMVKIDVFQMYNGKYIEFSNFFILFYEETKNNYTLINLPVNYFDLIEVSLSREIEKFMFSTNFFKPFKSIKRMFSLARIYKDENILSKILPLLNGDCGLLYQIISDFNTIIDMLPLKNAPLKQLMEQLDKVKYRLANITGFDIDEEDITDAINKIVDPLDKLRIIGIDTGDEKRQNAYDQYFDNFDYINDAVTHIKKSGNIESTVKILKTIKKDLNDILNGQTIKYLKNNDLYPPPSQYLPSYDKRKYRY